tara:strand:+ start:257 stop:625 length:369 start_codon:yes stop_codon:yes gene_type:complete
MATFDSNTVGSDVSPSFSPSLSIEQNVEVVELGDGYQQRLLNGLNTKKRRWTLPFNSRSDAVTTNILNFLESSTGGNNGQKAFTWTPPYGLTGKWVCDTINVEKIAYDLNNISLQFVEVFET